MNENILEKISAFADKAHGEQKRKYTPDRYIVHPVRVMEICSHYTSDMAVLGAALLHDVLEDTPTTAEEIKIFLNSITDNATAERTVHLVIELTDEYVKSKYPRLNRRQRKIKETARMAMTNADAQTIKYADIIDNCKEIATHDPGFAPLFLRECENIIRVMEKGDPSLRTIALNVIAEAKNNLKLKTS